MNISVNTMSMRLKKTASQKERGCDAAELHNRHVDKKSKQKKNGAIIF